MKKKIILITTSAIVAGILITAFVLYWNNFRGLIPLIKRPSVDISEVIPGSTKDIGKTEEESTSGENKDKEIIKVDEAGDEDHQDEAEKDIDTGQDGNILELEDGFSITIFAADVPAARVLANGPGGNIWVSQTGIGKITRITVLDGIPTDQVIIFEGLMNPHGIAFDPEDPFMLYIAEEDKISRVRLNKEGFPDGDLQKIIDLPRGGRHYTRTIGFGPDGRLYVSVGSTCDVCVEQDNRVAKIFSLNKDGSDFKEFAGGLRNAVFFRWHPVTGQMWATEMGRDMLGDDLPPDEINIILEGKDYGWPYCYGKNINDTDFDASVEAGKRCQTAEPSFIDIPAHSAPLKITRYELDKRGNHNGNSDFISGWLDQGETVLGRPVDIIILEDGIIYISDDRPVVIYRVEYQG
jgi:glucose/arabinose dehydrogenase